MQPVVSDYLRLERLAAPQGEARFRSAAPPLTGEATSAPSACAKRDSILGEVGRDPSDVPLRVLGGKVFLPFHSVQIQG